MIEQLGPSFIYALGCKEVWMKDDDAVSYEITLAQPLGPRWKTVSLITIYSQLQRCVWKSGLKGKLYKPIWSYIR